MSAGRTTLHQRINITLPEETIRLIDRLASRGERSRLIAEAIRYYVRETDRADLRKRLQAGALRRAERDLKLSREWFFADEEIWQHRGR